MTCCKPGRGSVGEPITSLPQQTPSKKLTRFFVFAFLSIIPLYRSTQSLSSSSVSKRCGSGDVSGTDCLRRLLGIGSGSTLSTSERRRLRETGAFRESDGVAVEEGSNVPISLDDCEMFRRNIMMGPKRTSKT